MSTDPKPPDGFNLDAEASRQDDAAKEGVVARETDPVVEVGDPAAPDPSEPGHAADDDEIDDPGDTEAPHDI